jgi:hypothetical protein
MIVKVPVTNGWRMFSDFTNIEWYVKQPGQPTAVSNSPNFYDFTPQYDDKPEGTLSGEETQCDWQPNVYVIFGERKNHEHIQILTLSAFILNDDGKTIERL